MFLDERRNLIIDVNQKLDESQELLEQIGLEINQNTDSQQKASQLSKFKCYQVSWFIDFGCLLEESVRVH